MRKRRYCIIYISADAQEFQSNLTTGFRDTNEICCIYKFIYIRERDKTVLLYSVEPTAIQWSHRRTLMVVTLAFSQFLLLHCYVLHTSSHLPPYSNASVCTLFKS